MSVFERVLVEITTWIMALTGVVYFVMKYVMRGSDPFSAYHHPWQPHVLALHVLLGPLAIFALGLIVRGHVVDRWREPRQRRGRSSGAVILALAAPVIASGYVLQVLTGAAARGALVGVHVAGGLLYTVLYGAHLVFSRPPRRNGNGHGAGRRARRGASGAP